MGNITCFAPKQLEMAPNPISHYIGDNIISNSNWPDETGRANLVNIVGGTNIWVNSNYANGHKCMKFGNNTALKSNIYTSTPPEITQIYVCRQDNNLSVINQYIIFLVGNRNTDQAYWLQYSAGNSRIYVKIPNSTCSLFCGNIDAKSNEWLVVSLRFKYGSNWLDNGTYNGILRINGKDTYKFLCQSYGQENSSFNMMGADYEGHEFLYVAEAAYYNRVVDGGEYDRMEQFLAKKYNITLA